MMWWVTKVRNIYNALLILEENKKPVRIQGKKVGVDSLPSVILNGYNYRCMGTDTYSESRKNSDWSKFICFL
jgi:hypothetical protein